MKILFIGDYSALHATFARELRKRGHKVTLVSDGCKHMEIASDVSLSRAPGIKGAFSYLFNIMNLLPQWQGYDVVQLINPGFLSLKPGKLAYFFRQLKSRNGKICLTLAGNDHFFVDACLYPGFFRFSQFRVGTERTQFSKENRLWEESWMHPRLAKYTSLIYENIDAAVSTLYEYDATARPHLDTGKLHYVGLPIDLDSIPYSDMSFPDGKTSLFVGMVKGREVEKGTDRLLDMALELESEMPDKCKVVKVSNLSLAEYLGKMRESHIVLDQLYSYSPGFNGLDAMAMGRVAGSGAQPEFYEFLGETDNKPLITLSPLETDTKDELRDLILNRDLLLQRGRDSRSFVEKHNDVHLLTDKLVNVWENLF